ncbi:MAG: polysaccharide deacetylase family protein [Treponema sp.]|jgi:peptidoglycan/xylan/chitin deacetylase (PgdA/CDA1 family)|nr:polysaccharide deacetylase family protein [Treponema sp.]
MITAYLTIDDVPSKITPSIVDYLSQKQIEPIMFCWGKRVQNNKKNAIYALQHKMLLQNHSFTHPRFSDLSLDQSIEEIEKTETVLESLYKEAGVTRPFKLFRFPFGDKGGQNEDALQDYLKNHGFTQLDHSGILPSEYEKIDIPKNQADCFDVKWTFDYAEYQVRPNAGFSVEDSISRANVRFGTPYGDHPKNGAAPAKVKAEQIILIHDHEETEAMHKNYFEDLINALLLRGMRFVKPIRRLD